MDTILITGTTNGIRKAFVEKFASMSSMIDLVTGGGTGSGSLNDACVGCGVVL